MTWSFLTLGSRQVFFHFLPQETIPVYIRCDLQSCVSHGLEIPSALFPDYSGHTNLIQEADPVSHTGNIPQDSYS